jgi:hypothetical protein
MKVIPGDHQCKERGGSLEKDWAGVHQGLISKIKYLRDWESLERGVEQLGKAFVNEGKVV